MAAEQLYTERFMEERIARLEEKVDRVQSDITEVKADIKDIRGEVRAVWVAIDGVKCSLAALEIKMISGFAELKQGRWKEIAAMLGSTALIILALAKGFNWF